jgi:heme A synthase
MPSKSDPPARFARYAWAVLVYNLGVVLWGAYVRATGSGAGCGNHWPLCNGPVTPETPAGATIIEFTHRLTSGFDLALVAVLVVWGFRVFPPRHPARLGAALSGVFLVTEALLGAALVLLEHVARNASANRAWSLSMHLINTLTLLAFLTLTAWWAGGRPGARPRGREAWLAAASLAVFMLLGVSGAIAALGDTLFPVRSLSQGFAQDLNPAASIFLRLRIWHPVLAACAGLWLGFWGTWCTARRPDTRLAAGIAMALVGIQLAAGMTNLFLLAPVWMQLVHLLLADLLWISVVLLAAVMLAPPLKKLKRSAVAADW